MPTLQDLLRLGLPTDAEVLAGASNLWCEVTWVVRLRARPPAIPPLAGGELVLVSIGALQALDARPRLARIVDQLAELGAVAAAVVGPVEADAERAAERNHLPLIQLPPSSRADTLELELQRWLVQRKADVQHEQASLYHELTGVVLSGGFPALLDRTVHVTRKSAVLQGPDWRVRLRRHPSNGAISAEEVDAALAASRYDAERWINTPVPAGHEQHLTRLVLPQLQLVRLVAQVSDGQRPGAYLSLVARPSEFGEWDAGTLLAAASAGSIELVREHASAAVRDAVEGDLLARLRRGQIGDGEALDERARRLGFDLAQPYMALAVRAAPSAGESLLCELLDLVPGGPVLTDRAGDTIVALLPCEADVLLEWHRRRIDNGEHASGGMSGPAAGVGRLAQALGEAEQALQLGERVFGPDRLVTFAELGIYSFLLRGCSRDQLLAFYDGVLGSLTRYDAARWAELVATLEAFFASRCSPELTAKRLHLHRNGLLYRLRRIEEIGGVRLQNPETRLMLHLALRAGQVLSLASEAQFDAPLGALPEPQAQSTNVGVALNASAGDSYRAASTAYSDSTAACDTS
jgi:PucR family transcriptional regulator, purine catabolism regulatory protein